MFAEIRIYYEGDKALQPGLSEFFSELRQRAKERRCRLRFISAGSGSVACRDFGNALTANAGAWNILLKDSEGPHADNLAKSLCQEYRWDHSHADSIFWMVEMMESWFHADKEALEKFYGQGFKRKALKSNPKVESIPKLDIKKGLQKATKDTKAGGYFDKKTSHGPKLLGLINPQLVREAAPNCNKLFVAILEGLTG